LAYITGDDRAPARYAVYLGGQMLGLDFRFRSLSDQRMLVLPVADLFPPSLPGRSFPGLHARRELGQFRLQLWKHVLHVSDDRQISVAILAHLGWIDVYVDNL